MRALTVRSFPSRLLGFVNVGARKKRSRFSDDLQIPLPLAVVSQVRQLVKISPSHEYTFWPLLLARPGALVGRAGELHESAQLEICV
jgi:hypothetical protein